MDRVALVQVLLFPPVSIIPPIPYTDLHHNITVIRRTSGRSLGPLKRAVVLLTSVRNYIEKPFEFVFLFQVSRG